MIKKTYIPSKPRNPKLSATTGTSGAVGKTEFNQFAGSSHEHHNKGVLDQITEAMLVGALRDLITSTDTESELTDENILSSLRVLSEISKANADLLEDLKEQFLSKVEDDTAQGFIEFLKGISVEELATLTQGLEVGAFTTGALGSGAALKMIDGTSYAEVDNLIVRQKATFRELIIESLKHIGGQLVLTPARMKCIRVVDGGTFYKCYFDTGDGEVTNEFVEGDYARCQVFTGSGTKFYWRLVTLVGDDWINLSKTSAAVGSDAPEAGDDITQLGNATDTTRQSAIILSTVGIDAPSWKQYSGINSFSLEGKETTVFSKLGNRISGETVFTSGGANLEDHLDGVAQDILDALQAAQDAEDKAQQAIEDAEADVATINAEIGRLQDQIDGKVSNWYYAYTPTLSNYPASDWTTNEIKDSHIGDTFTNTEPAPAENAGKSWRFIKDGSTYAWMVISDSDALKALQEASKAQATADGKSTTYLFQPTKYELGDMWVLNDDHTINGTHYKQGDLLTATQDSETFHEAHWLKRVRYTDDTKIDNLEIGGRNYVLNSDEVIDNSNSTYAYLIKRYTISGEGIPVGDDITLSVNLTCFEGFESRIVPLGIAHYREFSNLTEGFVGTKTFTIQSTKINNPHRLEFYNYEIRSTQSDWDKNAFVINWVKLEKGTKATDWTPAPEDVEANIATAKAEAESAANAYAEAQAEAERVKAEAYADDIVTAEEQARIDDVNDKLAVAKAYAEAQDALLKTQQEAYADGKISTAEQAAIDAAKDYADLKKTEAQAYADGIVSDEEARAIADAQAKYEAAKAHAEQLVDDIEVGGRNLLLNSKSLELKKTSAYLTVSLAEPILAGTEITISLDNIEMVHEENPTNGFRFSFRDGGSGAGTSVNNVTMTEESRTLVLSNSTDAHNLLIYGWETNGVSGNNVIFHKVKVEKGNKATDWTPAPEDVQADIATAKADAESAAQAYADTKAEAERVIAEAYADDIVTAEEQARIDDVNNKLALAKEYAEAQDALLKIQQEAYADEHISTAEQAAITAAQDYADLKKTEAEAYADDIVTAEEARAIADALEKYNASKAHAESLVDNLVIGGRNYVLNSDEVIDNSNSEYQYLIKNYTIAGEGIPVGDDITLSVNLTCFEGFESRIVPLGIVHYSQFSNLTEGFVGTKTFTIQSRKRDNPHRLQFYNYSIGSSQSDWEKNAFVINWVKLEKGTKATDWTAAPEDVQADITTAKADAESAAQAYADTKAEAERVIAEAYADDIVTAEEQARIDDVNNKLALAKEYAEAQDALLKIQQEAYADEHISTAEQAAITAAQDYADLKKTEAEAYADDIVTAEEARAIADALAKYNESKAYAETLVNDLEIGGRNLLLDSKILFHPLGANSLSIGLPDGGVPAGVYTISFNYEISDAGGNPSNFLLYSNGHIGYVPLKKEGENRTSLTFTLTEERANRSILIYFGRNSAESRDIEGTFYELKLEKGTKATDWTPAPEDVEANAADPMTPVRYIRSYLKGSNVNNNNTWVQIQALNKAGTNIALGKTVTASTTGTNLERITNGVTDYSNTATVSNTGKVEWVQVDLGKVYYDIKSILHHNYWHSNPPTLANRIFNDTKIEVSTDGVTWKTIFDSAVEGTYVETQGGKAHTTVLADLVDKKISEADAKAQALEYLKLAIGEDPIINGALFTLVTILLKERMDADVTAGISGLQGAAKNLPAFWAGGTDVQAQQGTAKAIIRHDGTVKFTDADIKGIINAISGKIGGLTIKDGKLLIGDVGDHRIELDASSRKMIFTAHDDFTAGSIGFDAGGAILDLFKRYTGSSAWSSSVRLDGDSFLLKKIGLSDAVTITPTKIKITNGSNTTEILDDGVYVNGVKLTGGGGGSDYVHPSTHSADMITTGTLAGIVKANNNTAYTTKQVRNMILSTNDAISSQMANGDIWIKYE